MPPTSHFLQYFPLVIDALTYGIYSVLFFESVELLLTRRRANYKFHLACMSLLFMLSTIHIIAAWSWAFITDTATTAIYEVFTLKNPLPVLFGPDDPASVRRLAFLIKIRYSISNTIADGILIHRCYVIWGYNWRAIALPTITYLATIGGLIAGLLPLSGTSERVSLALCLVMTFFNNIATSLLAAGRIWWISRRASSFLTRTSRQKYFTMTTILIESGLIYPAVLVVTIGVFLSPATPTVSVLVCLAVVYHIVGIAPTLIIVRVGLGVSTDDAERFKSTLSRARPSPGDYSGSLRADLRLTIPARTWTMGSTADDRDRDVELGIVVHRVEFSEDDHDAAQDHEHNFEGEAEARGRFSGSKVY